MSNRRYQRNVTIRRCAGDDLFVEAPQIFYRPPATRDDQKVRSGYAPAGRHGVETANGRGNLAEFSKAVQEFPEVLDCYVVLGNVDFLLRIVTEDIKAYERFFFEKLSQLPGIQEVNSSIVMSDIKHTTVLPI